jgi:chromosome segregation ATPase
MATLDLVQVRWQQVRLLEASQVIEGENIALKKEIKDLKAKLANAAAPVVLPNPNAEEEKLRLNRGCANMRNILIRFQSELVKLKLSSVQEINWLLAQKQLLSNAFNRYTALYSTKSAEFDAMVRQRDQLQSQLSELQQEMKNGASNMSQEHDKLKAKYKGTRSDLIDAQAEINRLKEVNKSMEEKFNELSTAKAESEAHYNVSIFCDSCRVLYDLNCLFYVYRCSISSI